MADPKPQRQVAAKQEHAAKARWEKRPEDMDAEAAPGDGASVDQHVGDAAPGAESPAAAQAPAAAPSAAASSGPSFGLIGAGAAGVLGLVAAAAGGGGSKSFDVTPPVVTASQPEQPKPADPKPADPKPADPTPPQTQEPSHPDTPTTPSQPTQPTTPDHTTTPSTPDQTQQPSQPDTTTQPTTPAHTETTSPEPAKVPPGNAHLLTAILVHDSGASATDTITNDGTLKISGLSQQATWKYSLDSGATWQDGEGDGIPSGQFVGDGKKTVQLREMDSEGNVVTSGEFGFTLDRTAPQVHANFHSICHSGVYEKDVLTFSLGDGESGVAWPNGSDAVRSDSGAIVEHFHRNGAGLVGVSTVDLAGNNSERLFFPPILPGIEGDAPALAAGSNILLWNTDKVSGLEYSLDGGATWNGTSWKIPGTVFGGEAGTRTIDVRYKLGYVTCDVTYDFPWAGDPPQAQDVLGVHSADSTGTTALFTGTSGKDRFVVRDIDGLRIGLSGYSADQGDVIDLSNVLKIEPGNSVDHYFSRINGTDGYVIAVGRWGPTTPLDDQLIIGFGHQSTPPQVTIIYDGGKAVI